MRRPLLASLAPLLVLLACKLTPPDYTGGGGPVGGGTGDTGDGGMTDGGSGPTGGSIDGDFRFKLAPTRSTYSAEVRQVASDVPSAAYGLGSNGNTLAAMTRNSAGFTLLGVRATQSPHTYVTQVQQTSGAGLELALQLLANNGQVATGFTFDDVNGYVLVGVRDLAASTALGSAVQQVGAAQRSSAATLLGMNGYVITGMVLNSSGYTFIGFKNLNSTATYPADVRESSAAQLASTVQTLATSGFVVTALATQGSTFVLVSQKQTGSSRIFDALVRQVTGSELLATLKSFGDAGLRRHRRLFERRAQQLRRHRDEVRDEVRDSHALLERPHTRCHFPPSLGLRASRRASGPPAGRGDLLSSPGETRPPGRPSSLPSVLLGQSPSPLDDLAGLKAC